MKRLNPLYFLAFILTLYLISLTQVDKIKQEFFEKQHSSKLFNSQIENFIYYKNNWFTQKNTLRKINKIIQNSKFRKENIVKEVRGNKVTVILKSTNTKVLNSFLSKILNEKLILKKVKIEQDSIFVEIGV